MVQKELCKPQCETIKIKDSNGHKNNTEKINSSFLKSQKLLFFLQQLFSLIKKVIKKYSLKEGSAHALIISQVYSIIITSSKLMQAYYVHEKEGRIKITG